MDEQPISLDRQLKCVYDEIRWRKYVYPGRVKDGKMTQEEADTRIREMQAVADTVARQMQLELFT